VQQFAQKVLAGETKDLAELISAKAKDWLKKLRDGESSESVTQRVEKLKTALANAQITVDKPNKSMHVIVMEEGGQGSGNGPAAGGYGGYGGGYGEDGGGSKKHKPGKRVQFKVVKEGGKFVILEVAVH
jgi:hypothetical protein